MCRVSFHRTRRTHRTAHAHTQRRWNVLGDVGVVGEVADEVIEFVEGGGVLVAHALPRVEGLHRVEQGVASRGEQVGPVGDEAKVGAVHLLQRHPAALRVLHYNKNK